jgi:hypothetical protein
MRISFEMYELLGTLQYPLEWVSIPDNTSTYAVDHKHKKTQQTRMP